MTALFVRLSHLCIIKRVITLFFHQLCSHLHSYFSAENLVDTFSRPTPTVVYIMIFVNII